MTKETENTIADLYANKLMSGSDISSYLKERNVKLSARTIQYTVKRLGISRTVSQSFHLAMQQGKVKWQMKENKVKRPSMPLSLRFQVLMRDKSTCQLCGSKEFLVVDHVVPLVKGGTNALSNLQTLCANCNIGKRIANREK